MARIPAWGVGPFPSPRGQLPPAKGVPGSCAPRQGDERVVALTRCESPCLWRSPRPVPNGLCERGDSRPSFRGARHGPCHRPYSATPIRDGVQPERGVFWLSRHPLPYTSITARPSGGMGSVRTANESQPRTPHLVVNRDGGRGTVRVGGKQPRVFRVIRYAIGLLSCSMPGYLIMSVVEELTNSSPR